jgi:hypothetical protein
MAVRLSTFRAARALSPPPVDVVTYVTSRINLWTTVEELGKLKIQIISYGLDLRACSIAPHQSTLQRTPFHNQHSRFITAVT